MFRLKMNKIGITTLILVLGMLVTVAYAAGRIYTNKNLDDLKSYVDNGNLNIQAVDSEQQVFESQYNDLIRQKNENLKQSALLQNQIDRLGFTKTQYSKKREQKQLVEKHQLQAEYYNVCLLIKQLSLAQSELEVASKMVSTTEEKLAQGDATQLDVDDAKSKKKQVEDKIVSLSQSVEQGKSALKARLNENSNVQFDPNFTIPASAEDSGSYTLEGLRKNCADRNLQLLQINAYIGFHNILMASLKACVGENDTSYSTALSEHSKLQVDADILKQQIDQYAEKQYNSLKDYSLKYATMISRKTILQQQLDNLSTRYSNGIISEISYLSSKYSVLKEMLDVDNAIVAKLNAASLVNLIDKGIIQ